MKPILAALVLLPALAPGQAEVPRVSVDARGDDVREVIATLFAQVHRPYAIDAAVSGKLYVALDRMPFPKALSVVLAQAGLIAQDRDGVTMILRAPKPISVVKPALVKPVVASKPLGPPAPIPASVLARRVTTRLNRAPLAQVFAELGRQADVAIEIDPAVPPYCIDTVFTKASLRFALDRICAAARLRYEPSPAGIRIVRS